MNNTDTHCKHGHMWTEANSKPAHKRKYPGARYRQCRACARESEADRRRDDGSRWATTQRALRTATVQRKPMVQCWSCVPSPYTGIRGDVRADPDDGDPKCMMCGRAQQAKVVMG